MRKRPPQKMEMVGVTCKKYRWRKYFSGPETAQTERKKNDWHQPAKWRKNEILCQIFDQSRFSENPCKLGFYIDAQRWFGICLHLNTPTSAESWVWRIADTDQHGITNQKVLEKFKHEHFPAPSSFSYHTELREELKKIGLLTSGKAHSGFVAVQLVQSLKLNVPLSLQQKYGAYSTWCLPKGTNLGSIVSLGILVEAATGSMYRQDVQEAVSKLNQETFLQREITEDRKERTDDEKKEEIWLQQSLMAQFPMLKIAPQVPVIFPSQRWGKIDLLIQHPSRVIIELKMAKYWTDAIGQIYRYRASALYNSDTLSGYKMCVYLVNCTREGKKCVELEEAKQVFPGLNFACRHSDTTKSLCGLLNKV